MCFKHRVKTEWKGYTVYMYLAKYITVSRIKKQSAFFIESNRNICVMFLRLRNCEHQNAHTMLTVLQICNLYYHTTPTSKCPSSTSPQQSLCFLVAPSLCNLTSAVFTPYSYSPINYKDTSLRNKKPKTLQLNTTQ